MGRGSKYEEHYDMTTKNKAVCKKCGQTYNISGGQRSAMKNHLSKKHGIEIPDEKSKSTPAGPSSAASMDSYVKKEPKKPIEDLIAEEAARGT